MPILDDRITFCQNMLSDTIRIVDRLDKENKPPEEYFKWISYLVEFIERVTDNDPEIRAEIERHGFSSMREYWKPKEIKDFYDAITKGVEYLKFFVEYYQGKRLAESPSPG